MEVYSKGATPRVEKPGTNYYYEGASSSVAADISDVASSVTETLKTLKSEVDTAVPSFNKLIEELDANFGTDFIKLNDQKLGFVDVEAFNALSKDISKSMDNSASNSDTFFSTCTSAISDINSWLSELEANAAKYNAAAETYRKETTGLMQNKEKAAAAKAIMDSYTALPSEPMSYGDWIKE